MFAKLENLEKRYLELEGQLSEPGIFDDQERYRKLTKAHSDLKPVVELFRQHRDAANDLRGNKELENDPDPEIRAMAHDEIRSLQETMQNLEHDLKLLLLPKDPLDEKNILLEVRAGTGGE